MAKILKCKKCSLYTISKKCPKCSKETVTVEPPKFSPADKYGEYRRRLKRQNGNIC